MTQEYQEGDLAVLRLHVAPQDGTPADATTAVTVRVVAPTGQISTPTAHPGDTRADWSATVELDEPGEWRVSWRVTGHGAGVEPLALLVEAMPGASTDPPGRVYATSADFARWPGATLRAGVGGALAEASRALDSALIGARYTVDQDGYPTDPRIRAAFRDAVCAQVAYWDETGDTNGTGGAEQWSSVGIGSVQLSRAARGKTSGADLDPDIDAPAALRILRTAARLFPIRPGAYG